MNSAATPTQSSSPPLREYYRAREPSFMPPRRLSKAAPNTHDRHSMYAQQGANPNPQPSRPPHSRTASLLNFSFRNRTSSAATQQREQQQQQQLLSPPQQNHVQNRNSASEFGAMNAPPPAGQRAQTMPTPNGGAAPNGHQQQPGSDVGPRRQGSVSQQALHPEIRSIVHLCVAHAHKVYFSGPLVKHVERQTDGKIVGKEEPWREVWAQLGGTTLSVWDMKEIEEASKRGEEVPPTYLNITDASVHVLGAVTMPGANGQPVKHSNVITLTTAGMNLMLFSCPTPGALMSWTAALRLASYEKARLEELYTAHLLRMSLSENGVWKDPRSPLIRGRLEGWVQIRISGQTDWKRLWMVLQGGPGPDMSLTSSEDSANAVAPRKNRMSNFFGRPANDNASGSAGPAPAKAYIALYTSPKPKDRKRAVLTLGNVSQVFAVYPERPELISRSTLIKIEGFLGDEELAGEWRCREGWLLLMPEAEAGKLGSLEMLKWLVALHDAFCLYGRPATYTWNPRDPASLMFSYPVGPQKENLFLDRELVEEVDPREDRTSVVRQKFKDILVNRMFGQGPISPPMTPPANGANPQPPSLPPIQGVAEQQQQQSPPNDNGFSLLPPLNFESEARPSPPVTTSPVTGRKGTSLSPITERSNTRSTDHHSRASTQDHGSARSPPSGTSAASHGVARGVNTQAPIQEESPGKIVGDLSSPQMVESPPGGASPYPDEEHPPLPSPPGMSGQMAPRFRQDSSSSGASHPVVSPTQGLHSPPHSPPIDSSSQGRGSSPGAEPANVRLPASGMQPPATEQVPSMKSQSPSPPARSFSPPAAPTTPPPASASTIRMVSQQSVQESPESLRSRMSVLTSPYDRSLGAFGHGRPLLDVDQSPPPPPPPEKSPTPMMMSPQPSSSSDVAAWQQQQQVRQQALPQPLPQPRQQESPPPHEQDYVFDEAGALYYVQQQQRSSPPRALPAPQRRPIESDDASEPEDDEEEEESGSDYSDPAKPAADQSHRPHRNVPPRRQTPMVFENLDGPAARTASSVDSTSIASAGETLHTPRTLLTRKPSGARAPNPNLGRRFAPSDSSVGVSASTGMPLELHPPQPHRHQYSNAAMASQHADDDDAVNALAALSFLEQQDAAPAVPAPTMSPPRQQKSAVQQPRLPSPPQILEPADRAPSPAQSTHYKSSFAPSKQAAERKARSQAQQAAHDAAVHKPGRPNGKQRAKQREGGWESSEEEEEEEEGEGEEDSDSDDGSPRAATASRSGHGHPIAAPVGRNPIHQQQMRGLSPSSSGIDIRDQHAQQKSIRTLPQIPRGRSPGGSEEAHGGQQRRYVSDQYNDAQRRHYDDGYREQSLGRPQPQYATQQQQQHHQQQQLGPSRQNMWSSVLDAGRDPAMPPAPSGNNRDTFVQLESPAETMTKAFTPQGLLSAGLQDKQDRSAKRQEEVARETGASLINVPNKPPPPQTGLLGAISAHERERKREGGVGAALTEREREKRMAEDRQRKLDDFQRQQLEQQQQMVAQGGGMYGMGMYGGSPSPAGGLAPQMTGMNPMMGSGYFPPMMGGPQSMYFNPMMMNPMFANPQHMYAAQQAAQAYQQAMVAMSAAGSQVGGEGGGGGGGGSPNPNAMMGGGMGFDPRMSMVGMQMGMPMGMGMGMGMGMSPMGSPMGMQMTGGSNPGAQGGYDPRFSLGPAAFDGTGGALNPNPNGYGQGLGHGMMQPQSQPQSQRVSSYGNSPAPSGSPAPGPSSREADPNPRA